MTLLWSALSSSLSLCSGISLFLSSFSFLSFLNSLFFLPVPSSLPSSPLLPSSSSSSSLFPSYHCFVYLRIDLKINKINSIFWPEFVFEKCSGKKECSKASMQHSGIDPNRSSEHPINRVLDSNTFEHVWIGPPYKNSNILENVTELYWTPK